MGDKYTQRITHGNRNAAQQQAGVKNVKIKKYNDTKNRCENPIILLIYNAILYKDTLQEIGVMKW